MAIHAAFAKKVIRPQDSDDCFLALLRNDSELYLAPLGCKKNRICLGTL
jgi:hypothetical protein